MSAVVSLIAIYSTVGAVSYALIANGHWITGAALTLILLLGTKLSPGRRIER